MTAAQVTNLSLLSRGVGEVQQDGHEKIEVKLEPEDYNNWLEDTRRVWHMPAPLPPIQSSLPPNFHHPSDQHPASHDPELSKVYLPKTFTTRKGALLLFSEDFANKRLSDGHSLVPKQSTESLPELRTVDDLAKSILAYGATKSFSYNRDEGRSQDDVYLGFVHTRSRKYYERQYKPGFSAKRYLSSWSKLWDHSLLNKITNKGYIKPLPYQKKSDYDVSGIPLPYRILRQWLFAPGSIDGYSFYRQSKYEADTPREPTIIVIEESPRPVSVESAISQGSIKVTSLLANKELNYGELDSTTKESILTELLVKSAITHAIKKQKEYQETVSLHLEDEEAKRQASAKLYEFDMMHAIQSALDSSVLPTVSTFNLDPQGLIAQEQTTRKVKKGFRGTKGFGLHVSSPSSPGGSATSARSSFDARHRILPPIPSEEQRISKPLNIGNQVLPIPTGGTSHYGSQATIADNDEEYSSWRQSALSSARHLAQADDINNMVLTHSKQSKSLQSLSRVTVEVGLEADLEQDDKKSMISTMSIMSKRSRFSTTSSEAPYTKGITARQDPTTSLLKVDMVGGEFDPTAAITSWKYQVEQQELYADLVKKVEEANIEEASQDVPDVGESSVGYSEEHVIPIPTPPFSVPSLLDSDLTPSPPLIQVEESSPPPITETEFMEVLTEQAREIAKAVLEHNPEAGVDLAFDAKTAAEMLMSNLPDEQTEASTRAQSQAAEEAADESAEEGLGTLEGVVMETTVGQLVKEGLENLGTTLRVEKLDEHMLENAAPSTAPSPSVPSMHSETPSLKSSRHTSTQQSEMSAAGSVMDDRVPSVPSAHTMTPSAVQSRATSHSEGEGVSPGKSGLSSARSIPSAPHSIPSASAHTPLGRHTSQSSAVSIQASESGGLAGTPSTLIESVAESEVSKKTPSVTTPKRASAGKVKHETEFVVGKVADKTQLQQLYAPVESTSPPKTKAKAGKAKSIVPKPAPKKEPVKKVEKPSAKKPVKKAGGRKEKKSKTGSETRTAVATPPPIPSPTPVPPKVPTPAPVVEEVEEEPEEWKTPEPEEEPDMEFVIVRDEFSDEDEKEEQKPQLGSVKSLNFGTESPEASATDYSTHDEEESLQGLSNRDAQAAKRAAAKERRRKEVEKRRREREEALRKEREDAERKERIRLQMEEDRLRREEEIRLRKEMEREERERLEREEEAKLKAQRDSLERERRRKEELERYMEEKRRRALEEEERRKELQALKDAEEAERLRLEQEMLTAMEDEERANYLRQKAEEERLRKIAEEEARTKREEEAKRIWEELQKQEAERKRAEEILRQRLMFQRSLNVESHGMEHSQDITRAFVFSYYELLKWLGYEIPEWAQYGLTPGHTNPAESAEGAAHHEQHP